MNMYKNPITKNGKILSGYGDFGGMVLNKPDERATEALVFMAVSSASKKGF
jgi:hypothetical protein